MEKTLRKCGTVQGFFGLLDDNPNYRKNLRKIEEEFASFKSENRDNGQLLKIRTVIHIVHNQNYQNISDRLIKDQIAKLNEDFASTNSDNANVPQAFKPLIGKSNIQFELSNIDSQGNPSSGIIRVHTEKEAFSSQHNEIKFSIEGGSDAWDTNRFMNIWVGPLRSGLLGYAQFPGGPSSTDGVVVNTSAFGMEYPANAPFDGGRTLVHEVGHYLNLSHIWGESRYHNCNDDDYVKDTPQQYGPNIGEPVFPSHSCPSTQNGDMFMNYMDYVDDRSMVMFTKDQVARMRSVLFNSRRDILTTSSNDINT